ncbi:MAG: DUF4199 domain-containing protein [Chitinophagaceae bacterium]|nr:DUF4199 domain-containing protein [Chitinophagaceae bacterium]
MKKIVIIYGLIAGVISIAWFLGSMAVSGNGHFDVENGMYYGYATMLLAFSLIFVAIKNFRDKHNHGLISFGKAFRIGLFITLIASTVYVGVWLIDYFYFIPDFMDRYAAHYLDKMKASGATQAAISEQVAYFNKAKVWYKNPFFNALMTYAEILPVGLLVSLIAALILRRKTKTELQPQTA